MIFVKAQFPRWLQRGLRCKFLRQPSSMLADIVSSYYHQALYMASRSVRISDICVWQGCIGLRGLFVNFDHALNSLSRFGLRSCPSVQISREMNGRTSERLILELLK